MNCQYNVLKCVSSCSNSIMVVMTILWPISDLSVNMLHFGISINRVSGTRYCTQWKTPQICAVPHRTMQWKRAKNDPSSTANSTSWIDLKRATGTYFTWQCGTLKNYVFTIGLVCTYPILHICPSVSQIAATQRYNAVQLLFKANSRMSKKGEQSDFDHGMMPEGVFWVYQKLLISWHFNTHTHNSL